MHVITGTHLKQPANSKTNSVSDIYLHGNKQGLLSERITHYRGKDPQLHSSYNYTLSNLNGDLEPKLSVVPMRNIILRTTSMYHWPRQSTFLHDLPKVAEVIDHSPSP